MSTGTSARWRRVKRLVWAAGTLSGAERAAFLDRRCSQDSELRAEVERLLTAQEAGEYLQPPAPAAFAGSLPPPEEMIGLHVGAYELTAMVGTGGMGVVFRARRQVGGFEQEVAIKFLRTGLNAPRFVARFHREREALATLDHPNISRLLDGGTLDGGIPYLVMEFISGQPIDRWCDAHAADLAERTRLLIRVCRAVDHAHRKLVLHCDLKTSNVLVSPEGEPKLIDFGIARFLQPAEEALSPSTSPFVSRDFASPELRDGAALSTASDTYSLGVILDRLTRARRRDADLEAILRKALAEDPDQRYATPGALADDLQRRLERRPVRARRPRATYVTGRWIRRNPIPFGLGAALLGALVIGTLGIALEGRRADLERRNYREIATILGELLSAPDPTQQPSKDWTARDYMEHAIRRMDAMAAPSAEVEGSVRTTLGSSLVGLGFPARGREQLELAVDLRVRSLGVSHPDTVRSLNELTHALYRLGALEEAELTARRALDAARDFDGAAAAVRAVALNNLATIVGRLGDLDESEALHTAALSARSALFGPESMEAAESLNNLGAIEQRRGDLAAAKDLSGRALAIRLKRVGRQHPLVVQSRTNMAALLMAEHDYEEALPLLIAAREDALQVLGIDHPDSGRIAGYLGVARVGAEHYEEALEPLEDSLRILCAGDGEPDPRRLIPLTHALGCALRELGSFEDAEATLLTCLETIEASGQPGAKWSSSVRGELITLYEDWGRPSLAAPYRSD